MISEVIQSMSSQLSQLCIELVEKDWESKLFNRNVIAITFDSRCESLPESQREESWTRAVKDLQLKLEAFRPCLLTSRILALNQGATRALENNGFHLMECFLELEHDLKQIPAMTGKNIIRRFSENEVPQLESMAFAAFDYSRFHMDPLIDATAANTSRAEWVRNACKGRAEAVFVAEVDRRPVGFVLCRKKVTGSGTAGILDLIAVHPDYRRQKLGYNLTVEFLKFCRRQKYSLARVGTQAHNIPSIRMYEKTGFSMSQAYYSYHKHMS